MKAGPRRGGTARSEPPAPWEAFAKDRVGLDLDLELINLERRVGLDVSQRRAAQAALRRLNRTFLRQAAERRAHSRRVYLLHRRILGLNRLFDATLARQERNVARGWGEVRALLGPPQRRVFDRLMAERRRVEREFAARKAEQSKLRPPDGKSS